MNNEDLQFKSGNPGAVKHGNFINYYQFHPPENRINLLPDDIWNTGNVVDNSFVALDIGCNAGDLTASLKQFLDKATKRNCVILGVDIDNTLIDRANEKNNTNELTFKCLDVTSIKERDELFKSYLSKYNRSKFDGVFCFSTTMWIHLNHGDLGLTTFLNDISKLGEYLLIEPQPWKCYRSALKRLKSYKTIFKEYENLKMRTDVEEKIEEILMRTGRRKVWESERTKWDRKLLCFN